MKVSEPSSDMWFIGSGKTEGSPAGMGHLTTRIGEVTRPNFRRGAPWAKILAAILSLYTPGRLTGSVRR